MVGDFGFFIRPVRESDLASILEIAGQIGPGFTSLPLDKKTISQKLQGSLLSFESKIPLEKRIYFFVLEHANSQKIIGTAAIEQCAGGEGLFYTLEIVPIILSSDSFKIQYEHKILVLNNALQNASLLSTLYLSQDLRGKGEGSFLSRSRFLFIADFPSLFSDQIIASMRGYFDQADHSPFWDGLGQKFFDFDFKKMDFIVATQGTQIISDLYPQFPIYINVLPETTKQAIGKVHPNTEPALHVLNKEGFQFKAHVDVFDAGPIIECSRENIKTIRESKSVQVGKIEKHQVLQNQPTVMISQSLTEFRAALGKIAFLDQESIIIEAEVAKLLKIEPGQKIRIAPFKQGLNQIPL